MLVSHLMEGYRLICCLPTTTEGWWRKGGLIACSQSPTTAGLLIRQALRKFK